MKMYHLLASTALVLTAMPVAMGVTQHAEAAAASVGPTVPDEIIVTASPMPRLKRDVISGTTVLAGDDLREAVRSSIGETLRGQIGITTTFFGPTASRPIIRGQGGDRVRILQNGVDTVDASVTSVDHQTAASTAAAERIEILRGPNTLLYGASAVGGVINVLDNRIPQARVVDGAEGRAGVTYGSNADEAAVDGLLNVNVGEKLTLHADGFYVNTDDYEIKGFANADAEVEGFDGFVNNTDTETYGGALGASVVWEDGYFGLSTAYFDSNYGSPVVEEEEEEEGGDAEVGAEEEGIRIDLERIRFDAAGEIRNIGGFVTSAKFRFGYGNYDHTELEGSEIGTTFKNDAWDGRVEFVHVPVDILNAGNLTGAFGVQVKNRKFEAVGAEAFVPPTETDTWSVFVVEDYEAGPWLFSGGARVDWTEADSTTTNVSRNFTGVSASASARYLFDEKISAGVEVSRNERAPNAEELFSNGPHLATGQFEIGDSNLGEETAWHAEASLSAEIQTVTLAANIFSTWYDSYIFENETTDIEDGLPVFQFVQRDARVKGIELGTEVELFQKADLSVVLDAGVDYVRLEETDTQTALPRIPAFGYQAGLTAQWQRFETRVGIEGRNSKSDVAPLETATEGYTFVNASVAYTPFTDRDVRLVVQGRNLGNSFARPHTSFIKNITPLPGRDVRVSLIAGF
ncbi:MAG: TonB-dependent receptor [Rhodospirillaceae bacterium]